MLMSAQQHFENSSMATHDWMLRAVRDIDEIFGEGYARANPQLVGMYIQTAALDFLTGFGLQTVSASLDKIADMLDE